MNTNKINRTAAKLFGGELSRTLDILAGDIVARPVAKHRDSNGNSYCEAEAVGIADGRISFLDFVKGGGKFRSVKPGNVLGYSPTAFGGAYSKEDALQVVQQATISRLKKLAQNFDHFTAADVDKIFESCTGCQGQNTTSQDIKMAAALLKTRYFFGPGKGSVFG